MNYSVIIPAYNEEKVIQKTLNSLPKEIEKIVVCNGCTDDTKKRANKQAKVFSIKTPNVSKARNYGAKKSSGDILIFLDADTQFKKNTLEGIKKVMESAVVGTCKNKPSPLKLKFIFLTLFKNSLLKFNWSSGIIFCKKRVFSKIKGFNENLTKKETSNFIKKAKKYGNYGISNSYVITSMRRFEEWGILKTIFFWIKETSKPTKKDYPKIR